MNYDALIFDLDGTLYRQLPVRACMFLRLVSYYALRPTRIRELFLLRKYRQLREKRFSDEREDFGRLQLEEAARLCGLSPDEAQDVITSWMIHKPLKLIHIFRRRRLIDAIKAFQKSGTMIIVYSDYPVREKLCALDLQPDYSYWSGDDVIRCMKPDSSGLSRVIAMLGLEGKNILYIGDRDDKDGECARRAGIAYMDVAEFGRTITPPA